MNAFILTHGGLIAAQIISAWLSTGNSVAALWIDSRNPYRFLKQNRPPFGLAPSAWSIAAMVQQYNIPVQRITSWTDADIAFRQLSADVLITAMTLQIIPETTLSRFSGRAVNVHPSLLPYYRGPDPRVGMVLDGKANLYGGITLHCLSAQVDRGDIIGFRRVPYEADRGFIYWEVCLARAAGELVQTELQDYLNGTLRARPQPAGAGSYRKVRRHELTLSDEHSAARTKWFCDQLGASGRLRFHTRKISYMVSGFVRRVGPCTSKAARIGKFTIEFDAADARVRVARHGIWTRLSRFVAYWLAIVRTHRTA